MKVFSIAAILLGLSEARPDFRNHAEKKQVCCERRRTMFAASSTMQHTSRGSIQGSPRLCSHVFRPFLVTEIVCFLSKRIWQRDTSLAMLLRHLVFSMLFKSLSCGSEDSLNPPHAYVTTIDFQLRRFFAFTHHEWVFAHFRILQFEIDLLRERVLRAYSSSIRLWRQFCSD